MKVNDVVRLLDRAVAVVVFVYATPGIYEVEVSDSDGVFVETITIDDIAEILYETPENPPSKSGGKDSSGTRSPDCPK